MSIGDHLGWWGLIVGVIGIGTTILWPTQKWIGWLCIGVAALLIISWGALAIRSNPVSSQGQSGPNIPLIGPLFAIRITSLVYKWGYGSVGIGQQCVTPRISV